MSEIQDKIDAKVAQYKAEEADKIAALASPEEVTTYTLALVKRAKQAVRIEIKQEAQKAVLAYVKIIASDDAEIMAHVKVLEASAKREAVKIENKVKGLFGTRTDVSKALAGFVNVGDSVSEDDIYAQFKFARSDMRKAIIADLKKAKPEDRRWIDLDLAIGAYVLRGIGATPPAGWTGYEPQNLVGVAAEASDATLAAASMA